MATRILLIDDDEGYLLAAGSLLAAAGYEVSKAASPADARGLLAADKPDLILLDVIMPGQDGFTFAEQLAGDEAVADVPVVLVTAVADSTGQTLQAFRKDMALTVVDVLPKSRAHESLIDCVASALGHVTGAAAEQPKM
jgi:twitching motility two-component system response regulator PilH